MATAAVKYYNGTTELKNVRPMKNAAFAQAFPGLRAKRYDSFSMMVASVEGDTKALVPVTRVIDYKRNPSMHKCDGRCLHATGKTCECSCGGKNHGAGSQ